MVTMQYKERLDSLYLKVGQYEFITRAILETELTEYDIIKMHARGLVIQTGLASSFSTIRRWRISPKHLVNLVEKHGNIHAPTGQDKAIYDYQNIRKRNNS